MEKLVQESNIFLNIDLKSQKELFRFIADNIHGHCSKSANIMFNQLIRREMMGSTIISEINNTALPRAMHKNFIDINTAIITTKTPIMWSKHPVDLIFCIMAAENKKAIAEKNLLNISNILNDKNICKNIKKSENSKQIIELLHKYNTNH